MTWYAGTLRQKSGKEPQLKHSKAPPKACLLLTKMRGRKTAIPILSERERIERKIESGKPLTHKEVVRFVKIGYEKHTKRTEDTNQFLNQETDPK